MPSSDRKPKRDRPDQKTGARESGRGRHAHRPIQPPQYFDLEEPWDVQSAEALTRLYESGEGYVPQAAEGARRRPLPKEPSPAETSASRDSGNTDRAWLDGRLAEVAERLQASLAKINPDKAVEQLTHRLDAIEERFKEVLDRVAQRSDLDGLKLIEAHVLELSTHVEQTRSRLDRIDALDDRVEAIARKLDEDDHQRLNALEEMLQDYIAEWRKSNSRTTAALQQLEGAVTRVGDTLEALEAHKPVPDMSLSMLNTTGTSALNAGIDPISQVYAEAARSLEPDATRDILDAANYIPKMEAAPGDAEETPIQPSRTPQNEPGPVAAEGSPSLRGIRDKLRQAGLLSPDDDQDDGQAEQSAREEPRKSKPALRIRRFGPNLLLGGGLLVFGIIGYLLVDVMMARSAAHHAGAVHHGSTDVPTKTAAAEQDMPAEEDARASATTGRRMLTAPARIEGISSAMAAAFRGRESVSPPETTSATDPTAAVSAEGEPGGLAMLPMTIGPASLRQAALRGEAAAQVEVAARFAAGQGVERDLSQALQWYTRAAAQGSAVAQYRLAAFYERGWGAPRDAERARVWYARAAEQGHVKAMHNLGVLTAADGRGDLAAAAGWFAKAAELGLPDSQINLAILHQNGLGVPKDLMQAYKWLAIAARTGDREALARIDPVKAQLSADEVATADAAVSGWRARTPDASVNDPAVAVNREGSR